MNDNHAKAALTLLEISREITPRGWLRATSGNLSLREPGTGIIYITKSGVNKERLAPADVISLNPEGAVISGEGKPSFETAIHRTIYQTTDAGAVFHVHSVYNNVATQYANNHELIFQGHEMLKALGHWDEDALVAIPVVPNHRDINRVADIISRVINPLVPAILLERHGVYAFGKTADDALRHLEALEFLFEWLCLARLTGALSQNSPNPNTTKYLA